MRTGFLFTLLCFSFPRLSVPVEWVPPPSRPSLKIALTFDDGPHPVPTEQLCGVLAKHHVPATFFIVGRIGAKYPETLAFIADQGHEIANHTWSHLNLKTLTSENLLEELDRTRHLIKDVTGQDTYLFRTPGGTPQLIHQYVHVPAPYRLILWNVHSLDQEGKTAEEIEERVLSQVHSSAIILMHNGLRPTRDALDVIIPRLRMRGYEFVTVSEFLSDHRLAKR